MAEKSAEEIRREFLDHVWTRIDFWEGVENESCRDKLEGLTHSLLALLDGSGDFPSVDLIVRPHPDDKAFLEAEGEDWYPDGCNFVSGVMLHEQLYRHSWPTNTAPVKGS